MGIENNINTTNNAGVLSTQAFNAYQELISEAASLATINTNKTPLGFDAWGRNKAVIDYSLFHGVWTFDIPREMWLEYLNGVELATYTNATSVNGSLNLQGLSGQVISLMSKRHPRYQPNRGHLYSSSMLLPDSTVACNQEFGLFHADAGVFFRCNAGVLYAVRRTKIGATVTDYADVIVLPDSVDLTKGNVYDIQMQWRGVGYIFFYINQELVYTKELLGTLDTLSVWNPALPIMFRVDGAAKLQAGCVDVTSEGGIKENRQRGFIDSDEISLAVTEVPILLLHLPPTVTYNGNVTMNTRDIALRRISGYANDSTILKMYFTRTSSKFTGTVFTPYDTIGNVEYALDGVIVVDNLTTNIVRVITRRISANSSIEIYNPDADAGDLFLTHGDYVLVTMKAKSSTLGGASMEWGAEI